VGRIAWETEGRSSSVTFIWRWKKGIEVRQNLGSALAGAISAPKP